MSKKKIYLRLDEDLVNKITQKATEQGKSRAALIETVLKDFLGMTRVLCPECDGVFWVKNTEGKITCPYCGAKEGETIDDFIFE